MENARQIDVLYYSVLNFSHCCTFNIKRFSGRKVWMINCTVCVHASLCAQVPVRLGASVFVWIYISPHHCLGGSWCCGEKTWRLSLKMPRSCCGLCTLSMFESCIPCGYIQHQEWSLQSLFWVTVLRVGGFGRVSHLRKLQQNFQVWPSHCCSATVALLR